MATETGNPRQERRATRDKRDGQPETKDEKARQTIQSIPKQRRHNESERQARRA